MTSLLAFGASFAISWLLTKAMLLYPDQLKWMIRAPSDDRWHKTATPTFGGIAMVVTFNLCVILFMRPLSTELLQVLCGGLLIFLLGLADDIRPLPPYIKLAGQIAVTSLMVFFGLHAMLTWNPIFYIPLTLIWIVGITNAFNLLDNMDGLAGGTAFISAAFIGSLSFLSGGSLSPELMLIFMGSIAGFLVFNWNPARIFMGDCGSQWLGFTLASLAIIDTWRSASNLFLMLATPVLVMAVPIFDTALVTLNRKIHGRSVSQGGKDHSSHRLVALGLSERKTVWFLWVLSTIFGFLALMGHLYGFETRVLLAGSAVIFALVFGIFLTDVKVYQQVQTTSAPNILFKRRIVEVLIDTLLIGVSYVLAYLLRYDWKLNDYLLDQIANTLPLVIATKMMVLIAIGFYRGIWMYIDFEGFLKLLRSSLVATVAVVFVVLGLYRFEGFSRTLFIIDLGLLVTFMGSVRSLLRILRESVFAFPESGIRVLIVGAGDAARQLMNEIRRNRQWNLRPVALVDDDPRKKGRKILEIRVLGTRMEIPQLVKEWSIEQVVIAIPSIKESDLAAIIKQCDQAGIPHVAMQSLERTLIQRIVPKAREAS